MAYHYLMDLALILLSTKLLGLLTQRFQMPQVVGALLAGLLLGPAGLNILTETEFLSQLSELGVVVLMFSAGMGTDVQELKNSGRAGFWVALLGVIVPLLMGTGLAWGANAVGLIESNNLLEDIFIGTIPDGHLRQPHGRNAQGNGQARDEGRQHHPRRRADRRRARSGCPHPRQQPCRRR